jgi:hypothetical protein
MIIIICWIVFVLFVAITHIIAMKMSPWAKWKPEDEIKKR